MQKPACASVSHVLVRLVALLVSREKGKKYESDNHIEQTVCQDNGNVRLRTSSLAADPWTTLLCSRSLMSDAERDLVSFLSKTAYDEQVYCC